MLEYDVAKGLFRIKEMPLLQCCQQKGLSLKNVSEFPRWMQAQRCWLASCRPTQSSSQSDAARSYAAEMGIDLVEHRSLPPENEQAFRIRVQPDHLEALIPALTYGLARYPAPFFNMLRRSENISRSISSISYNSRYLCFFVSRTVIRVCTAVNSSQSGLIRPERLLLTLWTTLCRISGLTMACLMRSVTACSASTLRTLLAWHTALPWLRNRPQE